jgi:hypothetical protein
MVACTAVSSISAGHHAWAKLQVNGNITHQHTPCQLVVMSDIIWHVWLACCCAGCLAIMQQGVHCLQAAGMHGCWAHCCCCWRAVTNSHLPASSKHCTHSLQRSRYAVQQSTTTLCTSLDHATDKAPAVTCARCCASMLCMYVCRF